MSRSRSRSPLHRSSSDRDRRDRADRRSSRIDQKSDRMVYLSNLPWELKWMELKDIIREKAGEVNFVEVLEDRDGRSKGCAVVEFKHREGADKCIENMHRTELRDRMIVAKEIRDPIAFFRKVKEDTGIDFLGGGDRLERSRSNVDRNSSGSSITINENETFGLSPNFLRQLGIGTPLCNRIFITNIPYNIGVGRLYDICALAGKVTWFDLQLDKEGKSKGMAVCEYSHPIEAVQAVSMLNNQRLLDRTMAIRMDRYPKDSDRHREPNGLPFGLRGVGMGLGANGAPLTDVASVLSTIAPTAAAPQIGMNGGAATTPFATPAPISIAQPQSQQTSWVTQPSQIIIQPTPTMVQTPQTNFAQAAQEQHSIGGSGSHFQSPPSQTNYQTHATGGFFPSVPRPTPGMGQFGGQYQAKSAQSYVPQQANTPQSHASTVKYEISTPKYDFGSVGGYGGSVSQSGSSLGASLSGSSSNYDTSRVILIKNLPVDYTWQIVSDRVQQFGDLESVEMITPGVAKVRFMQLKDAERAKNNLQGTTVEGRAIGIEYL